MLMCTLLRRRFCALFDQTRRGARVHRVVLPRGRRRLRAGAAARLAHTVDAVCGAAACAARRARRGARLEQWAAGPRGSLRGLAAAARRELRRRPVGRGRHALLAVRARNARPHRAPRRPVRRPQCAAPCRAASLCCSFARSLLFCL